MAELGQFAVSGLTMGAIYALVALGFAVTFRATGIVNFAQGEFVMVGGLVSAGMASLWEVPFAIAIPAGIVVTVVIGWLMGLGLMRLEGATEFRLVLITLAVAIFLQAAALVIFGTDPFRLPSPFIDDILRFGGVTTTAHTVVVIVVTLMIMGGFAAFLARTRWGRAMVATSLDPESAASLGVNVRFVVGLAFVLSALMGAIGGVIIAPISAAVYHIGFLLSLKGFAAAVLGGMGNPTGAVAGGFLIGLVEALGTGFISSGYKHAIAMAVLIAVLLLRPQGLFGRDVRAA